MQNNDAQMQHIKTQLAKTNLAVNTLAALNLTVTSVRIDGAMPEISIIAGAGCNQLRPGIARYRHRDGQRITENTSVVADCKVHWEERT
ncbi:MAG: hypothetical protein ACPGPF_01770 [Pontibacterium sp.]